MRQDFRYLDYHGKGLFNAVFDGDAFAEESVRQELSSEILRIFHSRVIEVVQNTGEMPNIEELVSSMRAPLLRGVFTEANYLGEERKRIALPDSHEFPLRNAVNRSREKIESILASVSAKGSDAAFAFVERLVRESREQNSQFKTQAEEAIRKHQESERARAQLNSHLSRAIGKFREDREKSEATIVAIQEESKALEAEKSLLSDKINRLQDIFRRTRTQKNALGLQSRQTAAELTRISQELSETQSALGRVEEELVVTRELAESRAKSHNTLLYIEEQLEKYASSWDTSAKRFASIIHDLEKLRLRDAGFTKVFQDNENLKMLNERLIDELGKEKDRQLDHLFSQDEAFASLLEDLFAHVLDGYFDTMLSEHDKDVNNDTAISSASERLFRCISILRTRGEDPIYLAKKYLAQNKDMRKKDEEMKREYGLLSFQVEWVYSQVMRTIESRCTDATAISAYQKQGRIFEPWFTRHTTA